jgi:hypothetical protein
MPVEVLRTNAEYVAALHKMELDRPEEPLCSATSFLSSVYFPESALERFFRGEEEGKLMLELLLERQAHVRKARTQRREIYESQALTNLVISGKPHDQNFDYHVTPGELSETLEVLLETMGRDDPTLIGVTREVLPLVFQIKGGDVLVDIRTNYHYQGIQGLLLTGETEALESFLDEFERLWSADETLSDQADLRARLEASLAGWKDAGTLSQARWPTMKTSGSR